MSASPWVGLLVVSALMAGCGLSAAGLGEIPDASLDARASVDGGATGRDAAGDSGNKHDAGEPDALMGDAAPSSDSGGDAAPGPDAAACNGTVSSCGPAGACANCTNAPQGSQCLGETCGCMGFGDCPVGQACSPQSNTCSTSCAGGLHCNGGCCDGKNCQTGSADKSCGTGGSACTDCSGSSDGTACLDGGVCGCNKNNDCLQGQCQLNECQ